MDLGNGLFVDGSWELTILVVDLQVTRRLRVSGETHIGGLMLSLVEAIDVRMDWSDHGLWWPARNRWLLKTRRTLDQCGVQSDAKLEFHRMHGFTRVQLPDLREVDLRLSYAQSVFSVVVSACRELGIRHPEELSLQQLRQRADCGNGGSDGNGSLFRPKGNKKQHGGTPGKSPQRISPASNPLLPRQQTAGSSSQSPRSFAASLGSLGGSLGDSMDGLADSPRLPASAAAAASPQRRPPRTPAERAAAGCVDAWLDSSRSLMEQGVRPSGGDCDEGGESGGAALRLRFKYHAHYDLNPQLDAVRINQLYEQVKWTVLTGCQQCTDEEALLLAALQLQAQLGAPSEPLQQPQQPRQPQQLQQHQTLQDAQLDAEIDAAISDLEKSLSSPSAADPAAGVATTRDNTTMEKSPELAAWLKVTCQPARQQQNLFSTLTLRPDVKRRHLLLRDAQLLVCASDDAEARRYPVASLDLVGAEVLPDTSGGRLSIRLLPQAGGDWWQIRFPEEARHQFAEWSAGLGLAARGRTLASRDLFAAEVRDILARLELQRPASAAAAAADGADDADALDIQPADFLPQSALKRAGKSSRSLAAARILELRAKVRDRSRVEAKLEYIRAWQRLPMSGVAYFSVGYSEVRQHAAAAQSVPSFEEFRRARGQQQSQSQPQQHQGRPELFGVAFNRIMRIDPQSGEAISTWRYNELDSWTVNWEVLNLSISLRRPPHYICLTPCPSQAGGRRALCKTMVEFIGGYVFLSLRKPDKSQELDEQMFHKLTCCREPTA